MSEEKGQLRQNVGLLGVVTFGAGTAIGVSIFSVLQPAAEVAGSGLLIAMVIAALPMILFAMAYAYLAAIYPVSGASYEWPRRFLHPFAGFSIAWLRILGNIGAQIVLAQVLVNYLGMAFDIAPKPVMAAVITLVFGFNFVGVKVAAYVQSTLMIMLLVILAAFVATGLPQASTETIGNVFTGASAILSGVALMITLFLGIESAVEIGEEVRNGRRTIPLGIGLAIALTVVVYAGVAITALGLVGAETLASSKAPLLDAARVPFGDWALPIIVGGAVLSIVKTMNATALIFSRSLFAMARTGVFPSALARIHPRFGTPYIAVLTAYGCAMAGLLLPSSLVFLLLAVNIPTMLKYMACSLSATRVARLEPELAARNAMMSPRFVRIVGYGGVAAAAVIILAGLGADVRPYLLVLGWFGVGVLYWFASSKHRKRVSSAEAASLG